MENKSVFRIIALVLSIMCSGFIFGEYITTGLGILSFYVFPVFVVSSIFFIVIPSSKKFKYLHNRLSSFVIWIGYSILGFCLIFINQKSRDISPIKYAVEFFWEEGIYIEFRENGTFKAINEDMLSAKLSYGKYVQIDSKLILQDEVKFGLSTMNDTLIINQDGIAFTLDSLWRVREGTMRYKRK